MNLDFVWPVDSCVPRFIRRALHRSIPGSCDLRHIRPCSRTLILADFGSSVTLKFSRALCTHQCFSTIFAAGSPKRFLITIEALVG